MAFSSTTNITTLPIELQLNILEFLPPASTLALRITSYHFNTLIARPTIDQLILAEKSKDLVSESLVCVDCVRLRPVRFFSERMRGLGGRKLGGVRRRGVVVGEGVGIGVSETRFGVGSGGKRMIGRVCLDCESRPGWARIAWRR